MSNSTHPSPVLRTIPDTQARLGGVSRTLVYGLLAAGRLEAIKVGRRRMVVDASIDKLVADSRRKAAA